MTRTRRYEIRINDAVSRTGVMTLSKSGESPICPVKGRQLQLYGTTSTIAFDTSIRSDQ